MITCDFDHTLRFENGTPNRKTIAILDNRPFVIISTRKDTTENRDEIQAFVEENHLNCVNIFLVNDEREKAFVAMKLNSVCHFEDSDEAIKIFLRFGIPCVHCFDENQWNLWLQECGIT